MRQRSDRLPCQGSRVHERFEDVSEVPLRGGLVERTPLVPAEHRGTIDQHDLLNLGIGADVKESVAARDELIPQVVVCLGRLGDTLPDFLLHLGQDRAKDIGLVGEVVIQGAFGDPSRANELRQTHMGVPGSREQTTGFPQQGLPRLVTLFRSCGHDLTLSSAVDIPMVRD